MGFRSRISLSITSLLHDHFADLSRAHLMVWLLSTLTSLPLMIAFLSRQSIFTAPIMTIHLVSLSGLASNTQDAPKPFQATFDV